MNVQASNGMSPGRLRSGGTVMGNTFSGQMDCLNESKGRVEIGLNVDDPQ